jgi:beta-lactamase superfamily II metal-dependent hydrolase
MRVATALLVLALAAASLGAQGAPGALRLYLIDVEGGNATLLVSPSGESMLIDTGNAGAAAARDAGRILAAAADAGITQLDYLVTTHYHGDHYGAMSEVVAKLPVRNFVDHGVNVQPSQAADAFLQAYAALHGAAKHTVVKPGDRLDFGKVQSRVVASAGNVATSPVPGAGQPNPLCAANKPQDPDATENAQSVGQHFTFGRFRAVHLGDLTWNAEFGLMCPTNRLGEVDLFIVSHHGQATSNNPVLVHALRPRVALLNNGPRKGGQPDAMKVLFSAPDIEDLWQMHFSQLSGQEYTVPGMFIANLVDEQPAAMVIDPFVPPARGAVPPAPGTGPAPAAGPPVHNGQAYWFKVVARDDGSFTVTNARNNFTKSYAAPQARR